MTINLKSFLLLSNSSNNGIKCPYCPTQIYLRDIIQDTLYTFLIEQYFFYNDNTTDKEISGVSLQIKKGHIVKIDYPSKNSLLKGQQSISIIDLKKPLNFFKEVEVIEKLNGNME